MTLEDDVSPVGEALWPLPPRPAPDHMAPDDIATKRWNMTWCYRNRNITGSNARKAVASPFPSLPWELFDTCRRVPPATSSPPGGPSMRCTRGLPTAPVRRSV